MTWESIPRILRLKIRGGLIQIVYSSNMYCSSRIDPYRSSVECRLANALA